MSGRGSVRSGKCPVGEVSGRGSVRSGKCPVGEVSGRGSVRITFREDGVSMSQLKSEKYKHVPAAAIHHSN